MIHAKSVQKVKEFNDEVKIYDPKAFSKLRDKHLFCGAVDADYKSKKEVLKDTDFKILY